MNILSRKIFSTLVKILTSVLIVKNYKEQARETIFNYVYGSILNKNYERNIQRIRKKQGKIRVAFLVNENQKWNMQSLYDELLKSNRFEPIILITPLLSLHKNKEKYRADINDNENFFKEKNITTQRVYDITKKKYLFLDKYNIDILFYMQPWELHINQHILKASQTMLTCYIPYCFHMLTSDNDYIRQFHKQVWTYFVESNLHKQDYEQRFNAKNCVALGHTRMDNYSLYPKEKEEKPTIIYAPYHHSLQHNFSTLSWNKDELLNFAKNHTEFNWIFKPHPSFKSSCIKYKIWTEEEMDNFYNEWEKIANLHTQGDNFKLFNKSTCLITDCISFLAEYMPTKNPVFYLQATTKANFNELGKKITSHYYKIHNWEEFEETFNKVLIQNEDYLKEERLKDLECLKIDKNKTVAKKVIEYLEKQLM